MFRRAAALLFVLCALPICAAAAIGAVTAGDRLLGETIPSSSGKRGLAVGLMGIWGTVLFGFLLGQVDWITDRIAGHADASALAGENRVSVRRPSGDSVGSVPVSMTPPKAISTVRQNPRHSPPVPVSRL